MLVATYLVIAVASLAGLSESKDTELYSFHMADNRGHKGWDKHEFFWDKTRNEALKFRVQSHIWLTNLKGFVKVSCDLIRKRIIKSEISFGPSSP